MLLWPRISHLPVPVIVEIAPLPVLANLPPEHRERVAEFFSVPNRNRNTKRAYAWASRDFFACIDRFGIVSLDDIKPGHVAAWVDQLTATHSVPTAKARLAGVRHLLDWLTTGHVIRSNPAHAVRGPSFSVGRGKTPVLTAEEARRLIDAIDVTTLPGLRDRALIATMIYSFARIGAATRLTVEDVFTQNRRLWLRLSEKRGKRHEIPCHHTLEAYLDAYLERAGIWDQPKAYLITRVSPRPPKSPTSCPRRRAPTTARITLSAFPRTSPWVPAFAGMTKVAVGLYLRHLGSAKGLCVPDLPARRYPPYWH